MEKTIAAIATAMSPSGIGIVRISGPEAMDIADKIYRNKSHKKLVDMDSHTIHYGFIYDDLQEVDEVLVSVMRAPHTYTGEDTVEINCHGGLLVVKKVLELVLKNGAQLAEPGEFSKRSFLNGKMDLAKAEAVIDVIHAKNDFALKSSVKQLSGALSEKVKEMRDHLLDEAAYIEAAMDDPEHYDLQGYNEKLKKNLLEILEELKELIQRADYGSVLAEGVKTVIAGLPNAGKSSLLNLLSGQEKAIVTEVEGTTRDTIEENIILGGISLLLMDTAGIRDTKDQVEKIGVEKARQAVKNADLILYVVDREKGFTLEDRKVLAECKDQQIILLLNKSDVCGENEKNKASAVDKADGKNDKSIAVDLGEDLEYPTIEFSAKTGLGLKTLEKMILAMFQAEDISYNDQVIVTNVRHKHLLEEAEKSVKLVLKSIENQMPEDFYTIDLMNGYTQLGYIIGEEVEEDVVDRIFEKFCMGK